MKQVCVHGNGQLGRMLRQAGEPLGIAVWPVGLEADPEAVPVQQSVITAEIERWPETALTRELARHSAFVNRDVFPIIADRLTQKQLFDKLALATAPWQHLADKNVQANGTEKAAKAYLNWLYSPQAQTIITDYSYRVNNPDVMNKLKDKFPQTDLFRVEDKFGSWPEVMKTHFTSGGELDKLLAAGRK